MHDMKKVRLKKRAYVLIAVVLLVVFAICRCACGHEGSNGETLMEVSSVEGVDFGTFTLDTVASLSQYSPESKTTIHMSIKYAKNNDRINREIMSSGIFFPAGMTDKSKTLKQIATDFMRQYVEDYKQDFGEVFRQEAIVKAEKPETNTDPMQVSYDLTTRIAAVTDTTFCYLAEVHEQAGGMHPTKVTITRNMSKRDGHTITLNEFLVPGYQHPLEDLIVEQMAKDKKAEGKAGLQAMLIFAGIDPYVSETFIIGNDGVTFIYNEDEIAPHPMGEIRVKLSYDQIKQLMK